MKAQNIDVRKLPFEVWRGERPTEDHISIIGRVARTTLTLPTTIAWSSQTLLQPKPKHIERQEITRENAFGHRRLLHTLHAYQDTPTGRKSIPMPIRFAIWILSVPGFLTGIFGSGCSRRNCARAAALTPRLPLFRS